MVYDLPPPLCPCANTVALRPPNTPHTWPRTASYTSSCVPSPSTPSNTPSNNAPAATRPSRSTLTQQGLARSITRPAAAAGARVLVLGAPPSPSTTCHDGVWCDVSGRMRTTTLRRSNMSSSDDVAGGFRRLCVEGSHARPRDTPRTHTRHAPPRAHKNTDNTQRREFQPTRGVVYVSEEERRSEEELSRSLGVFCQKELPTRNFFFVFDIQLARHKSPPPPPPAASSPPLVAS